MRRRPPFWLAPVLGLLLGALPALAEEGEGEGGAPADSTGVDRPLLSSDGAVSVFEEAVSGEGIEGFWWEYDPGADLERLLDDERREVRLEPVVDGFGFALAVPDTIAALRDSVKAVADSILAERVEVTAVFSPKFTSSYDETKDRYVLKNEFDTNLPLTRKGSVTVRISENNQFNESTGKIQDNSRVSSNFNYQINDGLISTFALGWTDGVQERNGVTGSESENLSLDGQVRDTRSAGPLGKLETSVGLSYSQRNYRTTVTDGESSQISPSWKTRLTRDYEGGTLTLDYNGDLGSSRREEVRTVTETDSLGQAVQKEVLDESDETNFSNTLNVGAGYQVDPTTDLKFSGSFTNDRFQYLSQVDSLQGRQETRTRESQSANLTFNSKRWENIEVRGKADYRVNETGYDLEGVRSTRTTTRLADTDITYNSWEGGRWIFKMERSLEVRDYRTAQAGDVTKQEASVDFKQGVTANVDFEAAYLISLDSFEFDDKEANTGDRDLRTQRGTSTVRYRPFSSVTSSVRMELRQTESINISPLKSGSNNTTTAFLITPTYTWRIGPASFSGDFTADARYKVLDFDEDNNTLNRRFSLRQKWQHAFSERLSTEVQYRWEFSDQGNYNRSDFDGRRRFGKSRETRRATLETKVLYTLVKGIKTRVEYRRDADDQYRVSEGEKSLISELPTRQFIYAVNIKRSILRHVRLDVNFSQTFRSGPRVSDLESNYYNIGAQVVYEPFKKKERKGGAK